MTTQAPSHRDNASQNTKPRQIQTTENPPSLSTPLDPEIIAALNPRRFRRPENIPIYDGTSDPKHFFHSFMYIMISAQASQPTMLKAFPIQLQGSAMEWFCSLPQGSIRTMDQLMNLFLQRFSQRILAKWTAFELIGIKQSAKKSLTDFIDQFYNATMSIDNPTKPLLILTFMNGIQHCNLFAKLAKKSFSTFAELISYTQIYIKAAEAKDRKRAREEIPTSVFPTEPNLEKDL